MFRKNMGRLDRTLRFIAAAILVPIGLFAQDGLEGDLTGILVTAFGLLSLTTSLIGFCPGYVPFGISTLGKERNPIRLGQYE